MGFKNYLVVVLVFVLGVVVGDSLPIGSSVDNTALTQRSVVSREIQDPGAVYSPTNTYSPPADVYNPPADVYYPPTTPYSPPADVYNPPADVYYPPTTNTTDGDGRALVNAPTSNSMRYAGVNTLTKNLYRGNWFNDRAEVMDLQKFLIIGGFLTGTADGLFGPMTQQAVIKYQLANRISPAVGYVGPITREHINISIISVVGTSGAGNTVYACNSWAPCVTGQACCHVPGGGTGGLNPEQCQTAGGSSGNGSGGTCEI